MEPEISLLCSEDPSVDPILSQMYPFYILTPYFLNTYFNIIHWSTPESYQLVSSLSIFLSDSSKILQWCNSAIVSLKFRGVRCTCIVEPKSKIILFYLISLSVFGSFNYLEQLSLVFITCPNASLRQSFTIHYVQISSLVLRNE